jgi:hypothetical protein
MSDPIVSSAAIARLDEIVAYLRTRLGDKAREEHYVIGLNGQLRSHLVGERTEVITGGIPVKVVRGAITVHQHPGQACPPSEHDLVNALAVGERFTFVVARDGVHRLRIRQPERSVRYSALLDAAETIEARALKRSGWYGSSTSVSRVALRRMMPTLAAEIVALAAAYPQFLDYRRFPLESGAAELLN